MNNPSVLTVAERSKFVSQRHPNLIFFATFHLANQHVLHSYFSFNIILSLITFEKKKRKKREREEKCFVSIYPSPTKEFLECCHLKGSIPLDECKGMRAQMLPASVRRRPTCKLSVETFRFQTHGMKLTFTPSETVRFFF